MRFISVSIIGIMLAVPGIAASYLPTVDVAGSVSARAAFGVPMQPVVSNKTQNKFVSKNVVSRKAIVAQPNDNLAMGGDILSPNRPSDNLWASSDAPLRMPRSDEFTVLSSNGFLPEESLDVEPVKPVSVARVEPTRNSEFDEQIARLNELQRRADASVKVAPIKIESPLVAKNDVVAPESEPVKISQMVVPMDDVVVRRVERTTSPKIAAVRDDMTKMSPTELRKAFRKTFLSENKHLSTYQIDNKFDVASDMSTSIEGFTSQRDLSEEGGVRPLEIKIKFRNEDSALSRDNFNLLTEYAGIVVNNPKRAIQVEIPKSVISDADDKKLAARRLAIVEQVLRDTGVAEQRIVPVLASRSEEEGFVLRIISNDQYETLTQQQKNKYGKTTGNKTYKSLAW
ncbi:MAG: hypothetical protein KBS86_00885 [Proteobacteria bacterium]|nr:hypothetical protein [Candidatus Enterousia scatequi]